MKAYWELLRLEHGIMYAIGVAIGVLLASGLNFNPLNMLLGCLTAMFCQASAFALNDYVDYYVDVENKRYDRPLVRGDIKRETALYLSIALAPIGLLLALMISIKAFLIAFLVTVLGYAYDLKIKEYGLPGNAYIAFSMSIPFIFGSVVAKGVIVPQVLVLSTIAFLSGLGREIMKGIEDVRGDAIRNVRSLARVKGIAFASRTSAILFLSSVILSPIPFLFIREYRFDLKYMIPVSVTDVMLIAISLKLLNGCRPEEVRRLRAETLVAMAFGLLGFLLGAF